MARRQFLKNSHTHTHMGKRKHAPLHIQRLINFLLWDKNNEACAFLFESAGMVARNEKKSSNNDGNCNLPVYHPLREFAIDPPQSTCKETISHIIIFLPVLWTNLYCCCHFIIIYWVTWLRSLLIWLRHGWKLHPKQMKLNPRTSYTFTHTIFDIALLSMLCFHHLLEQHNLNCGGVVWLQIDIFCWWLFSRMDICGCGCGCGVYVCAISAFEYYGLCYYFIYCRQSTTNNAILFRICFLWLSLSLLLQFDNIKNGAHLLLCPKSTIALN